MSDIIIPGKLQEEESSESLDNLVLDLLKEAKSEGYETIEDYLKEKIKRWDTEKYFLIDELYEEFLQAVQLGKENWLSKRYSENSTFEGFLRDCLLTIDSRLEEIDWKMRTEYPSFPGLYNITKDPEIMIPGGGKKLSSEKYELYEFLLKKSKETLKEVLKEPKNIDKFLKKSLELKRRRRYE